MGKTNDPFDKFRDATLGSGDALSTAIKGRGKPAAAEELPGRGKVSKNADRKLVSFHIDKASFLKLGQLKFEMGAKYDELYNEAITDLLVKYGKA